MRLAVRFLLSAWADMRRWASERVDIGGQWARKTGDD